MRMVFCAMQNVVDEAVCAEQSAVDEAACAEQNEARTWGVLQRHKESLLLFTAF